MNKTITHYIVLQHDEIKIGETTFNTKMPMVQNTEFVQCEQNEKFNVYVEKIATFQCPGDSKIHMYRIDDDNNNGTPQYIIVNHIRYYIESSKIVVSGVYSTEYVERINYIEKMKSDNDLDAFREFAKEIEQYTF